MTRNRRHSEQPEQHKQDRIPREQPQCPRPTQTLSFQSILSYVVGFLAFFLVSYLLLRFLDHNFKQLRLPEFFGVRSIYSFQDKLVLIVHFSFYLAAHLFALYLFVLCYRLFAGKTPLTHLDPPLARTAQKILSNSIQMSIIFVTFYSYWLLDKGSSSFREAVLYPTLFLISRICFSWLYLLGVSRKYPWLRGFGLGLQLATTGCLLWETITGRCSL